MEQGVPDNPVKTMRELAFRLKGDLSLEELAVRVNEHAPGRKLSGSSLSKVFSGQRPYDAQLVRALALALGEDPAIFAEYRLAVAREQLDERVVGLEQAVTNLALLGSRDPGELLEAELRDAVRTRPARTDDSGEGGHVPRLGDRRS